ncbi:MAG: hypothetical protein SFW64_06465 [Alphaproteobacteria bacterium]|nr:hypothetical protein [Alphaproteobacteria bacterium]
MTEQEENPLKYLRNAFLYCGDDFQIKLMFVDTTDEQIQALAKALLGNYRGERFGQSIQTVEPDEDTQRNIQATTPAGERRVFKTVRNFLPIRGSAEWENLNSADTDYISQLNNRIANATTWMQSPPAQRAMLSAQRAMLSLARHDARLEGVLYGVQAEFFFEGGVIYGIVPKDSAAKNLTNINKIASELGNPAACIHIIENDGVLCADFRESISAHTTLRNAGFTLHNSHEEAVAALRARLAGASATEVGGEQRTAGGESPSDPDSIPAGAGEDTGWVEKVGKSGERSGRGGGDRTPDA